MEQQLQQQSGYKHAGGVEEVPRSHTQHQRLAHQAAAGSLLLMLGSDGFYNAVTTVTMTGQLDSCKDKHQCQTQRRRTEQRCDAACRKELKTTTCSSHFRPHLLHDTEQHTEHTPSMLITV